MSVKYLFSDYADPDLGAYVFDSGTPIAGIPFASPLAGFQLSSLLHFDRYTTCQLNGNCYVDIDLSNPHVIRALGMYNVTSPTGAPVSLQVDMYWSINGITWTLVGTAFGPALFLTKSDAIYTLPTSQNKEWWRLVFIPLGGQFSIGKIALGDLYDFGGLYTPGSEKASDPPSTEIETENELLITHITGKPRERMLNIYNGVTDAARNVFRTLARSGKPFGYIDHDGVTYHMKMRKGSYRSVHRWSSPSGVSLWDVQFEMTQLP